ncbi:YgzB family protein [Paenibacillus glycinis]|uniref:Uncharacterized protein n=1 Tax=Paenibacillus glycinis TaxID=2697035 RepID=A0ABW9XNY9_9BACL|nr:YgzB family protein [Paenibacillus glycinis]NBD24346.1 hypothetical protein [Paenibacillus glycinis]
MFGKSSKINEFRLWGLLFTLFGMGLMILGTAGIVFWGQAGKVFAAIFMVIGMIAMLLSVGVYFWAGMLSTSATILVCPECNRHTKILGKTDRCMYCKTKLTLDPNQATDLDDTEPATEEVGQPQT